MTAGCAKSQGSGTLCARHPGSVSGVAAAGGAGGAGGGEAPAGTPFTGARTDMGALAAFLLSVLGAILVALTGRRPRPTR